MNPTFKYPSVMVFTLTFIAIEALMIKQGKNIWSFCYFTSPILFTIFVLPLNPLLVLWGVWTTLPQQNVLPQYLAVWYYHDNICGPNWCLVATVISRLCHYIRLHGCLQAKASTSYCLLKVKSAVFSPGERFFCSNK